MGIKTFFKRAGNWVKDKFHKGKQVVSKFVKPVVKVAKKVVNFVDKTPLGPIISKASGGIFDTAKKVINLIPDGDVKKNVQNFTSKAEATANQAVNQVSNLQDKAKGFIDRGRQAWGIIKNTQIM